MKTKKIFFFGDKKSTASNLTVKTLKGMHINMDHGSHAEKTADHKSYDAQRKS